MPKFNSDFVFGVATSAYQIEGAWNEDGKGKSIWDTFCETEGKVARGETGKVANDHYHRFESDLDLIREIGAGGYRFSLAWPRMFPNGDEQREQRGFDFYNRLIDGMLERGIKPFATLYHWDLPQPLQDIGGWENREITKRFADYSAAAVEAFGDRVEHWAPLNEPWVFSWLGYGNGYHAPGVASIDAAIRASHHTVLAHNQAFKAMKAVNPNIKVGPVLSQMNPDVDDIFDPDQMLAARVMDATGSKFWMDGLFKGAYPELAVKHFGKVLADVMQDGDLNPVANDWLGINYYCNARIGHRVPADHPTRVRIIDEFLGYAVEGASVGKLTDMGWPITPYGLEDLLVRWTREYPDVLPPMYVTENGVAYDDDINQFGRIDDARRIEYLNDHLLAVSSAIERGADVRGYFQWSLMDNFEWAVGYAKRFGIVHVDYETQVRTIKESGRFYSEVIKSRGDNLTRTITEFA